MRRPDPSRGSARTLARKWLERRCSAVGKSAGRVSPREGRAEKERLSGLRGEREDRELEQPDGHGGRRDDGMPSGVP